MYAASSCIFKNISRELIGYLSGLHGGKVDIWVVHCMSYNNYKLIAT